MEKKRDEFKEGLRCERCKSTQTRIRKKTKDKFCNSCGYSQKIIGVTL